MSKGRHIHKRAEARRRRIVGEPPPAEPTSDLTARRWVGPEADAAHLEALRRGDNEGERIRRGGCADTVDGQHGPADAYGKCPWCGSRYTHVMPRAGGPHPPGEIETAYRRTYDPDFRE